MTLEELSDKVTTLQEQIKAFARESLEERADRVLELQKIQLFEGKASDGNDIRPYYSEDLKANGGFFKTPESAQRYAQWKAELSYPYNVQRNFDAPNLYINGRMLHHALRLQFTDEDMEVIGTTTESKIIMAKYGAETFGLTEESLESLRPDLTEALQDKIRLWIE